MAAQSLFRESIIDPLAISLTPPIKWIVYGYTQNILILLVIILSLFLYQGNVLVISRNLLVLASAFLILALTLFSLNMYGLPQPSLETYAGEPVLAGGMDGLTYRGFAMQMLEHYQHEL